MVGLTKFSEISWQKWFLDFEQNQAWQLKTPHTQTFGFICAPRGDSKLADLLGEISGKDPKWRQAGNQLKQENPNECRLDL